VETKIELKKYYSRNSDHRYLLNYKQRAIQRGNKIIDMINKYKNCGDLLDVGCGYGFFLNFARENGWEVSGVELSEGALRYARENYNLNIFRGDIGEIELNCRQFDLISLQHILEHISNPVYILKKLSKTLKDDGILVVVVPNASSLVAKFARTNWVCFSKASKHVFHYNRQTLNTVLKKSGYQILGVKTIQWESREVLWSVKVFLKRLFNHTDGRNFPGNPGQCNAKEETKANCGETGSYSSFLSRILGVLGLGTEIITIAKKADVA